MSDISRRGSLVAMMGLPMLGAHTLAPMRPAPAGTA